MGDPRQKSQRRSHGKPARPLRNFTLYLDENFDCAEVKAALSKAHIKFRLYSDHFDKGEVDERILELCGRHGWAMLTCDRKNRYRELERKIVLQFRVRQFVFSGNLGAVQLAQLLIDSYLDMRKFARENERPFIAVVTKVGNIYLRMDREGNVVSRG
jgi:hypothetical protein